MLRSKFYSPFGQRQRADGCGGGCCFAFSLRQRAGECGGGVFVGFVKGRGQMGAVGVLLPFGSKTEGQRVQRRVLSSFQ